MSQQMTALTPLLTPQRRRILAAIRDHYSERGYAPTFSEIADQAGLASVSSVGHQLAQLERMGRIRRAPGRSRALVVLDPETGQP